jgi:hypothetical protein
MNYATMLHYSRIMRLDLMFWVLRQDKIGVRLGVTILIPRCLDLDRGKGQCNFLHSDIVPVIAFRVIIDRLMRSADGSIGVVSYGADTSIMRPRYIVQVHQPEKPF